VAVVEVRAIGALVAILNTDKEHTANGDDETFNEKRKYFCRMKWRYGTRNNQLINQSMGNR